MVKISNKPGEPMGPFRITIDGESSYEKQILPGTQAGFNSLKTFYLPHSDNDYHKKITYNEVFKAVKKQIEIVKNEYINIGSFSFQVGNPNISERFFFLSSPSVSIGDMVLHHQSTI